MILNIISILAQSIIIIFIKSTAIILWLPQLIMAGRWQTNPASTVPVHIVGNAGGTTMNILCQMNGRVTRDMAPRAAMSIISTVYILDCLNNDNLLRLDYHAKNVDFCSSNCFYSCFYFCGAGPDCVACESSGSR